MPKSPRPALLTSTLMPLPPQRLAASTTRARPSPVARSAAHHRRARTGRPVPAPRFRAPAHSRPTSSTLAPRPCSSCASARPMPPLAPVISDPHRCGLHARSLAGTAVALRGDVGFEAAEQVAVEPEHALRATDDGFAIVRLRQPAENALEIAHVLLVQLAMAAQVAERLRRQLQRRLDAVGGIERQRDAGPFEHEHHAEEAERVAPLDRVVGIRDHALGRERRLRCRRGRAVATGVLDVVEDPLLVAAFLVEVMQDRLLQPGVARGDAGADRHHQRHGVTHVVVGLRQEFDVQLAGDVAGERALDGRRRQQVVTVGDGVALQLLVQVHRWLPEQGQDASSAR